MSIHKNLNLPGFIKPNALFGQFIGFEDILNRVENSMLSTNAPQNYPPYNLIKCNESTYQIELAVAGFNEDEIAIDLVGAILTIKAERTKDDYAAESYLFRGLSHRSFTRQFEIADNVKVTNANLHNGILTIELKKESPPEIPTTRIPIQKF